MDRKQERLGADGLSSYEAVVHLVAGGVKPGLLTNSIHPLRLKGFLFTSMLPLSSISQGFFLIRNSSNVK